MSDLVLSGDPPAVANEKSHAVPPLRRDARPGKRAFLFRWLWRLLVLFKTILLSPFTFLMAVRRSMTGASATLLVLSIVTLNIIWGYPWTGMFAACVSLMVIGWSVNQLMRPRLRVGFSLPRLSSAGQPFSIVAHVTNRRQLPALDLRIGFRRAAKSTGASRETCIVVTADQTIDQIPPQGRLDLAACLQFDHRGIQTVPDLVVRSMFPFHLFRTTTWLRSDTSIAITPRPLRGDEDSVSYELLLALGGWSYKLLSGDALDYSGSREYQSGMPVRRWDFKSWARLGRPIVREYQSPSIQMVSLLVDTSVDESKDRKNSDELLERVLSAAASAIIDLTSKAVRIRMYITHEEPAASPRGEFFIAGDVDALLIRLAAAERVTTSVASDRARRVLDRLGNDPVLVLAARGDSDVMPHAGKNAYLLRVDQPAESSGPGQPSSSSPVSPAAARESLTNGGSR